MKKYIYKILYSGAPLRERLQIMKSTNKYFNIEYSDDEYKKKIGTDIFSVNIKRNENLLKFQIWDTAPYGLVEKNERKREFDKELNFFKNHEKLFEKIPEVIEVYSKYKNKIIDNDETIRVLLNTLVFNYNKYKSYKPFIELIDLAQNYFKITINDEKIETSLEKDINIENRIIKSFIPGSVGMILNPDFEKGEFVDVKRMLYCFDEVKEKDNCVLIIKEVDDYIKDFKISSNIYNALIFLAKKELKKIRNKKSNDIEDIMNYFNESKKFLQTKEPSEKKQKKKYLKKYEKFLTLKME